MLYPVTRHCVGNNSAGMMYVVVRGPQDAKKNTRPNITIHPAAPPIQLLHLRCVRDVVLLTITM